MLATSTRGTPHLWQLSQSASVCRSRIGCRRGGIFERGRRRQRQRTPNFGRIESGPIPLELQILAKNSFESCSNDVDAVGGGHIPQGLAPCTRWWLAGSRRRRGPGLCAHVAADHHQLSVPLRREFFPDSIPPVRRRRDPALLPGHRLCPLPGPLFPLRGDGLQRGRPGAAGEPPAHQALDTRGDYPLCLDYRRRLPDPPDAHRHVQDGPAGGLEGGFPGPGAARPGGKGRGPLPGRRCHRRELDDRPLSVVCHLQRPFGGGLAPALDFFQAAPERLHRDGCERR
mmetsp:Transcript_9360/g.27953  ORF Transcript_9360/g.27953 Transcript_9360/m.27953 type:complete len:285 (+) Transcript_9360:466-1320(+)